ncbi:DUF4189 domain-containing protein [Nocardia sp. NPDC050378]|uniref:DUF4189 domain-containing protein n=1 Tax=Nocardia sp. NPDC050378 TaxID=3155400 RepID=UPI003404747A
MIDWRTPVGKQISMVAAAAAMVVAGAGVAAAEPGEGGRYFGVVTMDRADSSHLISAVNYPSWEAAEEAARELCDRPNCEVVARFVDECVSLAMNTVNPGGSGRAGDFRARVAPTAEEAEAAAIAAAAKIGPGPVMVMKTVCSGV